MLFCFYHLLLLEKKWPFVFRKHGFKYAVHFRPKSRSRRKHQSNRFHSTPKKPLHKVVAFVTARQIGLDNNLCDH